MYVPCAVKMFHLLTAACEYVSYFVRWTNDWLCFLFSVFYMYVLCAVKIFHLLTAACNMCPTLSGGQTIGFVFFFTFFVCMPLVL